MIKFKPFQPVPSVGRMLGVALCASVVLCAPGCKVVGLFFPSDQIELASDAPPAPIDSASTRGLEIRLWVVDDTDWSSARMLMPYQDDPNDIFDDAIAGVWADWGFRLVALPIEQVQGFLDALTPVQPSNVQWLGEFGRWRAIVRAGELPTSRVRVGDRSVEIEQGRPRLIARSWVEPMLIDDGVIPAVRVDLGLQIENKKRRADPRLLGVEQERMIEDVGPVLDELMLSMLLDGSHAVVLVGEAPDVLWEQLGGILGDGTQGSERDAAPGVFGPGDEQEQADTTDSGELSEFDHVPGTPRQPNASAGINEPIKPMGKTLGELMLTSPGSRMELANVSRVAPKRVVVVLVPRVEGGFSLLWVSRIGDGS